MDLWLQAVILVVFCVGFNATSWLLAPQKGKAKAAPTVPTVPTVAASPKVTSAKPSPVVGPRVTSAAKSPKSPESPKRPEEAEETQVTPLFVFDGLDFDGDRIVNLREKPYYFEEQLGGAMSISFIARWDAFALRSRIIDFGDGPLADNIIIANLETGRSLIVEVFRGPSKKRRTMPGCLALGETHRYLLSISESGLMRMLQDGSQLGVQPQGYAPRCMERRKLLVGGSNWSSDENFQGEISELKIWHGEVSWQTAFPNETPLPPPRPPKEVKPEATEDQADDLEVEAATSRVASPEPPAVAVAVPVAEPAEPAQEVEPPAVPLAEPAVPEPAVPAPAEPAQAAQDAPIQPAEDEEGWTAVSKSARKADKKAKAKLHETEVKTEVKKAVVVPAPPPPPDHGKRQKGRHKPEVKLSPATKPQSPPTPPPPPVKEHKKPVQEQRPAVQEEKPPVQPVQEQRSPLRQKGPSVQEHKLELPETKNKRGKAWADIPPEGTPPSSPPTAGLVLTVKNEEASEVLSPHTPDNGEEKLEDTGFEVLSGKKRPKVQPEVVTGPGGRPKAQEGNGQVAASEPVAPEVPVSPVPVSPQGTTLSPKAPAAAPSSLSPLEKEILRWEKKQREVEKLKQRQADGEELDHLQLKKLSCKDEMMQKLQELNLKKALERVGLEVNQVEGHGGSPEPWDLPKVPVDMPQIAPSSVPMGRTPLKAPREGFRPSGARQDADQGDSQLSSGAEIFTPGAMNSEVQFQAMQQMQQMAMVGGVGVEMENPEMPEESWDACWEWLQNGYCPRGETCRWDHPALQFPDGSLAVWPGHQPEMQTEQVFVMIPAENFSCQGCQGAPGSWTGPFAGDQMVGAMACDAVAMPCACSGVCGCGGCPQLPPGDAPFCGDSSAVPAIAADGQVAR